MTFEYLFEHFLSVLFQFCLLRFSINICTILCIDCMTDESINNKWSKENSIRVGKGAVVGLSPTFTLGNLRWIKTGINNDSPNRNNSVIYYSNNTSYVWSDCRPISRIVWVSIEGLVIRKTGKKYKTEKNKVRRGVNFTEHLEQLFWCLMWLTRFGKLGTG